MLANEELVVDVTVRRMPEFDHQGDRLACGLEGDRLVQEEGAACGIDHGSSLIADHRLLQVDLLEVRAHGAEHPSRRHDHGDPGRLRPRDRRPRSWAEQRVPADERVVEVADECLHLAREGGREDQPPVDVTTYAATSAICCAVSCDPKGGIAPMPFVTRVTTNLLSGFASSRFGPTLPFDPAAASVWQPPQPALTNTALPAVASPLSASAGRSPVAVVDSGTVPTTVSGVAVVSVPPRQPAASRPNASARTRPSRWIRRISCNSNQGCEDLRRVPS